MNEETQNLLEQILTAQVLLLSMQMDAAKKAIGTHRAFGDYSADAVRLMHSKRAHILELVRQNQG